MAMTPTYSFGGVDPGSFAKSTSVEPTIIIGGPADENTNIDRSKNSAFIPPAFGSPSADIPNRGQLLTPELSGVTIIFGTYEANVTYEVISNGSMPANNNSASPATVNNSSSVIEYSPILPAASNIPPPVMEASQSSYSQNKFTTSDGMFYEDGSIGTLSIPKLNVSGKVFEEESLENMRRGIGHFKFTSAWDGNAGFAAHNRGIAVTFGQIHTLQTGDKIVYTTKYGTRTYEVFFVGQIHETDFSRLNRTEENLVTLITCVNDIAELRWCVQAKEVAG